MSDRECYIAGNVNIGSKEKKRRLKNGWLYLIVTLVAFLIMIFSNIPKSFGLLIYIPVALSALGFLQAAKSFCVYYGWRKEYRLDEESGVVRDEENILDDKKTSTNIFIIALSIAFGVTILAYILILNFGY